MKKLLILIALCISTQVYAATTPWLICKVNNGTGLTECTYYDSTVPNTTTLYEKSTPYSALVPAGETRQIRITHASVNPTAPVNTIMQHILLIESPAGSGKWDIPLCWQKEAQGTCRNEFVTPIILNPGDELCEHDLNAQGGIPSGVSYAIHYIIGP